MTLATRCPSCGTVFRVVQDQLRVSGGWVRCGRCAEVFNAADRLVEMPSGATPRSTAGQGAAQGRSAEGLQPLASPSSRDTEGAGIGAAPPARKADDTPPWREPDAVLPPREREPELRAPERERLVSREPATASSAPPRAEPTRPRPSDDAAGTTADAVPTFVRQAEKAQRWRRPGVRVTLGLVSLAAVLGLASQALLEYRDIAAARWAALRPALEHACEITGCRIEAPRLIEGLVVDSSGLVRTEGTALYKLSVVLRNRATLALAAPSIDLALTDAEGSVVARKVLSLADLGVASTEVPPTGTVPLQAVLQIAAGPVTGYTIELFYP